MEKESKMEDGQSLVSLLGDTDLSQLSKELGELLADASIRELIESLERDGNTHIYIHTYIYSYMCTYIYIYILVSNVSLQINCSQ